MTRSFALLAALGATAAIAATPAQAHDVKKHDHKFSCCSEDTVEAYMGDPVNGEHVPGYVFVYADLNNDGVLRGRELRRAINRIKREDRGGRFRH